MSWITKYLFKSTLGSQEFNFFDFISCFITITPIVWPHQLLCLQTDYDLQYNLVKIQNLIKMCQTLPMIEL